MGVFASRLHFSQLSNFLSCRKHCAAPAALKNGHFLLAASCILKWQYESKAKYQHCCL